jgi:tRNA dimethylallyltransferase
MPAPSHIPILLAGPTASGKSALAMRIAEAVGGVVINADAIQVYRELRILSARPTREDEARVPHWLYGHVPAAEAYSVGRYVKDVAAALDRARTQGLRPILTGGTGLYFKALIEGLSPVPEIAAEVRAHWRAEAQHAGAAVLHAILSERDPEMARRLAPADTQRVTRALEVLDSTGRSLSQWQRLQGQPLAGMSHSVRLVMTIERADLLRRCDARFDAMVQTGAIGEVQGLLERLDPALPAMGALGVAPLAAHLAGKATLEDAMARAKLDTRQYVKRQLTWLKRNMITWNMVQTIDLERNDRSINQFIDECTIFD